MRRPSISVDIRKNISNQIENGIFHNYYDETTKTTCEVNHVSVITFRELMKKKHQLI